MGQGVGEWWFKALKSLMMFCAPNFTRILCRARTEEVCVGLCVAGGGVCVLGKCARAQEKGDMCERESERE
jgi:hypothetical protein